MMRIVTIAALFMATTASDALAQDCAGEPGGQLTFDRGSAPECLQLEDGTDYDGGGWQLYIFNGCDIDYTIRGVACGMECDDELIVSPMKETFFRVDYPDTSGSRQVYWQDNGSMESGEISVQYGGSSDGCGEGGCSTVPSAPADSPLIGLLLLGLALGIRRRVDA